jgi:hypothetical protein
VEGQEQHATRDDGSKMIVLLVQPLKNIEDEVAIKGYVVEVAQGVGHALHLATVVAYREVTLDEGAKHGIEVKHKHFIVVDELVLDHAPDLACGDVVLLCDVLKLIGDHTKDPGEDDALNAL